MACCLTAPSHYLNQFWFVINDFTRRPREFNVSCNGLVPSGNKPLPEPILSCHQWGSVASTWEQIHRKAWRIQSVALIRKLPLKNFFATSAWGQWVKCLSLATKSCRLNHQGLGKMSGILNPMYRWKEGISGFGQAHGQKDRRTTRKRNASARKGEAKGAGISRHKKRSQQLLEMISMTL